MEKESFEILFTSNERNALEINRAEYGMGSRSEMIDYTPKNRQLFNEITLFYAFSDHFEPSSTSETTPILELHRTLDHVIMNSKRKRHLFGETYDIRGTNSEHGGWLKLTRSVYDDSLHIIVDHILKDKSEFPHRERERFKLSDDGSFTMTSFERHSENKPSSIIEVAKISLNEEIDGKSIEAFHYFNDLIQPFFEESNT